MRGSYRYNLLLTVIALLWVPAQVAGQRQAAAALTAVVPPILKLETVATGGTSAQVQGYTEVQGAVVLRISANCRWRLVAVTTGAPQELQLAAASGNSQSTAEFLALGDGPRQVAVGGPSAAVDVVVDYRWRADTEPAPISYELLPVD